MQGRRTQVPGSSPGTTECGEGARAVFNRLASERPIPEPVTLVVAHPDDEVVSLGAHLHLFERLTLIRVTDGAPFDMGDAHRAGFATREAYAAARTREDAAALAVLGVTPERQIAYDLPDQCAVDHLADCTRRLARDLVGAAVVLTHAYEGGHPDHDACAFIVQHACARMTAPPRRLEFASYFGEGGRLVGNRFHPHPEHPAAEVDLSPDSRARKATALAAYASQAEVLANFPPERESFRTAPTYDFTRPPPPGEVNYDGWGWSLTSVIWRERAARAMAELSLENAR